MIDSLGYRLKMGIILPSTNTSMQPETDALRPFGVTNQVSRMLIQDELMDQRPGFMNVLNNIRLSTSDAIHGLLTCKPDRVIVGVSPESYWEGQGSHEVIMESFLDMTSGVPVTTSHDACKAALAALGDIHRIAILTPYLPVGDDTVSSYFLDNGYDVVSIQGLGASSPANIAQISQARIFEAIRAVDSPRVQAIVQVGTNVAMARAAMIAEAWLDKPVISNNVMLYWHALRSSGIADRVGGFGRLLERH
ncbi:maleate cis-trans isomerase family protein [Pseudomonas fulva]|nr:arylmalonate decarboxylase [Pseudomonas fulva]MBF8778222.1 arylmalonate decarboxylase [Pseudomonas fulva]